MTMSIQAHRRTARASLRGVLGFALLAAAAFNLSSLWAFMFLANIQVGLPTIDAPTTREIAAAVAINVALLAAFGLHHSLMARPRLRALTARLTGPLLERPFYILTAACALMTVMGLWQPIPAPIWRVTDEPVRSAFFVLYGFGWVVVIVSLKAIDQWGFLGLRQIIAALRSNAASEAPFQTPWLYRVVRHPMYLGLIITFWATPDMTLGHALYAAGMTLYILVGVRFEERGLIATFGETYRDYQRRVPMLLPWPR
jgi:protein-S-isoprenylcysteine O-methyltransferase Ste14